MPKPHLRRAINYPLMSQHPLGLFWDYPKSGTLSCPVLSLWLALARVAGRRPSRPETTFSYS
jgi:hypothetical protein